MAGKSLSAKELEELLGNLRGVFEAVLTETSRNPALACALSAALDGARKGSRAGKPALDPFAVYEQGWEVMLRSRLAPLNADQLADIIRAHKLDPKGRTRDRSSEKLRDWIVDAVERSTS